MQNDTIRHDIIFMCIAHVVCILLFIIKKKLSKKTDAGAYIKVVCNITKIVLYWTALVQLLMAKTKYYVDYKLTDEEENSKKISGAYENL